MGGPSKSRGLHPLPTCQNEGYLRVLTPLSRRQSWLTSGYQRGFWLTPFEIALSRPLNEKTARLLSHTGGSIAVRIVGGTTPEANPEASGLRLAIGWGVRAGAMLRHEEIELFLVLGMTQPIEEFAKLLLLFLEPPQRLHAVFIEGAVAARRRAERE